jgi:hypothetical protein
MWRRRPAIVCGMILSIASAGLDSDRALAQEGSRNAKQGPVSAASWLSAKGCQLGDPCVGCSFEVDHIDGVIVHLEHHAVRCGGLSRAPYCEIGTPGSISRSRHDQYLMSRMISSLRSQLKTVTKTLAAQVMMASNRILILPRLCSMSIVVMAIPVSFVSA